MWCTLISTVEDILCNKLLTYIELLLVDHFTCYFIAYSSSKGAIDRHSFTGKALFPEAALLVLLQEHAGMIQEDAVAMTGTRLLLS